MPNTEDNFGLTSRATGHRQDDLSAAGVSILGFKSGSIAGKAGMQNGDIIVEYDGMRNLTTDKLTALTTVTKPEGTQVRVVFMRAGHESSTLVPPGPLGISVLDTTTHTSSGQDFGDVFFSELTERFKRLGLGTLGAYLVLALLMFGAAAAGFLVIGSWDNLVIFLMMLLVPAMLLGFLYYLICNLFLIPKPQLVVVALFLGGLLVYRELILRSHDSLLIPCLTILSAAASLVLLWCFIRFMPSLRRDQGIFYGTGIGMWTGFGMVYALQGSTWDESLFSWLVTACVAIGAYLGRKMVDEKSKQ
jgi:hypothetical protein